MLYKTLTTEVKYQYQKLNQSAKSNGLNSVEDEVLSASRKREVVVRIAAEKLFLSLLSYRPSWGAQAGVTWDSIPLKLSEGTNKSIPWTENTNRTDPGD